MANPATKSISPTEIDWIGTLEGKFLGYYLDCGLLLVFGGIPWQVTLVIHFLFSHHTHVF